MAKSEKYRYPRSLKFDEETNQVIDDFVWVRRLNFSSFMKEAALEYIKAHPLTAYENELIENIKSQEGKTGLKPPKQITDPNSPISRARQEVKNKSAKKKK